MRVCCSDQAAVVRGHCVTPSYFRFPDDFTAPTAAGQPASRGREDVLPVSAAHVLLAVGSLRAIARGGLEHNLAPRSLSGPAKWTQAREGLQMVFIYLLHQPAMLFYSGQAALH